MPTDHVAVVTVDDAGEMGAVTVRVEVGEVVEAALVGEVGAVEDLAGLIETAHRCDTGIDEGDVDALPVRPSCRRTRDFDFSVTIFMITGSPGLTAIDSVTLLDEPVDGSSGTGDPDGSRRGRRCQRQHGRQRRNGADASQA